MRGLRMALALALLGVCALAGSAVARANVHSGCIAHRPAYIEDVFEPHYVAGCTGHDEPELDPVSSLPGSAKDLTWHLVLPANGTFRVDQPGPIFWTGGTVSAPRSLFGQAFQELQFYPNARVTNCTPNGGVVASAAPGVYTVCSPVWAIHTTGQPPIYHEPAAFNALLRHGSTASPLVMHARDRVDVHYYVTSAENGWHITVTDRTTGQSGTIVLRSRKYGPMMPPFSRQLIGNSLGWGAVHDTPNSFVWEIGHTSLLSSPAFQFCVPGEPGCYSYDAPAWAGIHPISILGVTFNNGSQPSHWAVVSDYGGKQEVIDPTETGSQCSGYGGPFCIYPWYSSTASGAFHFGVDYPDTTADYGKANQYPRFTHCGGPFGPNSTYCANIIR
jgi:hypothetical protein